MALEDKRLTDLTEKVVVPADAWVHIVDPSDTSQHPDGSSFKAKKENLGSDTFAGLSDVTVDTPLTGQVPIYNSTTSKWENGTLTMPMEVKIQNETLTAVDLATQDVDGMRDYINALEPSVLINLDSIGIFTVTDTGHNFLLKVNGSYYGVTETPITSNDILDLGYSSLGALDIFATIAALATKLPIASGSTTGVSVSFATDRVYGTIASPETGNITANLSGALLGVTNIIIHNNGSAPTFGSEFKKLSGSGSYVISSINYIYCTYINSTEIVYSINQRT